MIDRPSKRFYEFDTFRIDVEERQLFREHTPVLLTPKVFDILLALVEHNGHVLGKDQLMERVWAERFVEDGNLNRNISTLRKVLGEDSHHPRFIKTLPKRGYRFDADVREILEDDEELTVERRTNYRLAIKQVTETSRRWQLLSPRLLAVALPVVALLVMGGIWAANRADTDVVNGVSAAEIQPKRGTENTEAFELYQKARALWHDRTPDGLHQATSYLEQAIARDPGFALAHAALADAYAFDVGLWKKAEAAADEAIRLDPSLGQPHATIGFVRTFWEWRLREAEPFFKRSIALDPDYATAHQWYAINLAARGIGGSGLAEMKRALEIEPASLAINADLCQILYFARKYDQAIEQCKKTIEMDPKFLPAHQYLYEILTAKGAYSEAVEEYLRTEELNMTTFTNPRQIEDLKKAYAAGGIRAFWRERIDILSKPSPNA